MTTPINVGDLSAGLSTENGISKEALLEMLKAQQAAFQMQLNQNFLLMESLLRTNMEKEDGKGNNEEIKELPEKDLENHQEQPPEAVEKQSKEEITDQVPVEPQPQSEPMKQITPSKLINGVALPMIADVLLKPRKKKTEESQDKVCTPKQEDEEVVAVEGVSTPIPAPPPLPPLNEAALLSTPILHKKSSPIESASSNDDSEVACDGIDKKSPVVIRELNEMLDGIASGTFKLKKRPPPNAQKKENGEDSEKKCAFKINLKKTISKDKRDIDEPARKDNAEENNPILGELRTVQLKKVKKGKNPEESKNSDNSTKNPEINATPKSTETANVAKSRDMPVPIPNPKPKISSKGDSSSKEIAIEISIKSSKISQKVPVEAKNATTMMDHINKMKNRRTSGIYFADITNTVPTPAPKPCIAAEKPSTVPVLSLNEPNPNKQNVKSTLNSEQLDNQENGSSMAPTSKKEVEKENALPETPMSLPDEPTKQEPVPTADTSRTSHPCSGAPPPPPPPPPENSLIMKTETTIYKEHSKTSTNGESETTSTTKSVQRTTTSSSNGNQSRHELLTSIQMFSKEKLKSIPKKQNSKINNMNNIMTSALKAALQARSFSMNPDGESDEDFNESSDEDVEWED